ncbi:hypothetical protein, partial [Novosphingobium sp. 17-62-19]|uniref:hypothetical protein n=1 Tax=Novosphingobium sp. 17-62-19 TaxID=1970406 RepID=UPI0025E127E2
MVDDQTLNRIKLSPVRWLMRVAFREKSSSFIVIWSYFSKACGHLPQSNSERGKIDHCSVALIGLFIAGSD